MLKENERIDDLEYNGYKIIQNKNKFCFGIDSILLSNFATQIKKGSTVVDLGSGTGIIGILLCAKTQIKKIINVEIQKDMAEMSKRSIQLNKLEEKIEVINEDLKEIYKIIGENKIDAIVTNPPYKKENSGLENKDDSETISRQEVKCNIKDIIEVSQKMLKNKGELYMIHRPDRLVDIIYNLRKYKIEPKIIRFIHPKENTPPNLILIKAIKGANPFLKIEKPLIVYNKDNKYTDEILEIYGRKEK